MPHRRLHGSTSLVTVKYRTSEVNRPRFEGCWAAYCVYAHCSDHASATFGTAA